MPVIEDKILQRAVVMLLEPISEEDFKDFSYGFRPGRSAHQVSRQVEKLGLKLKGHFGYYGITGNLRSLEEFRWRVIRQWRYWLNRRDREHGSMPWERMQRLLDFWYLPAAKVVHSVFAKPCV